MNALAGIVDASAWVAMRNELYSPEVFPGVWRRLERAVVAGVVASPRQVLDEIADQDDALSRWMRPHRQTLERPLLAHNAGAGVENEVVRLRNDYPKLATRTGADYYVIAWAKTLGVPLVGTENPTATSRRKMAGVCREERMEFQSPLQFMRARGWVFS